MTKDEIRIVNATSRSNGAVGKRAIVPQYVNGILYEKKAFYPLVLDYGAGKDAMHVQLLAKNYPENGIYGYEIGENFNPDLHVKRSDMILCSPWDLIYASNVLNVQPSMGALIETIEDLRLLAGLHGVVIVNYPNSPRKLDLHKNELLDILRRYWRFVLPKESNVIVLQSK